MTPWDEYALTVIVQVSVISLAALVWAACNARSAARRHAAGVLGLAWALNSPLVALVLPRADWWPSAISGSRTESPEISPRPESSRAGRAALEPEVSAARTPPADEANRPVGPAPRPSSLGRVAGVPSTSQREMPRPMSADANDADARGWTWRQGLVGLAGGLWLAGAVVSAGFGLWRSRRLRRLARSLNLTPGRGDAGFDGADARFAAIAREVCDAVGLRRLPPIAVSPVMPMPLVLGLGRPVIVIPCELLQAGADRLRDVLIHEAAHVARRDAWINLAQRGAAVLWWWHPGVLGLNRVISRSREEVCDNFVLRRSEPSHYAQTLLDVAERCAQVGRTAPSLGLLESRWTLEARIRGLLKPGRDTMTRTKRRAVATIAVLFGTVCLLIGGAGAVENDQDPTPPAMAPVPPATDEPATEPAAGLTKVTVRGRCVDEDSEPLAGVRVLIARRSSRDYRSQTIAGETRTDAEGRFELRDIGTAMLDHGDLCAVAARDGYSSACAFLPNPEDGVIERELSLSSNPGTLSGVVRDPQGRPIPGVTVYLLCCSTDEPLPGIRSAVTDGNGRYAISDLVRWDAKDSKTFDPKTGLGMVAVSCNFWLKHPDYPRTTAQYSAVPQEVNVTLHPPAIVEGQVIDAVTHQPAAGVTVSAQGVARGGWFQTRTDAQGRYRLRMTRDHYNIWADADDRIAVAVKALRAECGETASDADIRLVRGGFVTGTVFGADGRPIAPTKESPRWVAHYGPARPHTGAAVTSTLVQPDGTYRLRVAPGRNYIYLMGGDGGSGHVTVADGQDVPFDIHLGRKEQSPFLSSNDADNADEILGQKIREAARQEDAGHPVSAPAGRQRPDTPIGKLLDKLAEQNAGQARFRDAWARTLREIIELGPDAVPELIAELDATSDNMMLRCLGFTLRAIGDRRAVPALIRAIPRTLFPPGSDMGLHAADESLAAFMRKHDLDKHDQGRLYGFGRPVREIFGALHTLTGHSFDDEQLYMVFAEGTPHQRQLQRELFAEAARKWADWWEQHWKDYVKDPAWSRVNLPRPQPVTAARNSFNPQQRLKTDGEHSDWVFGSYADPKTGWAFLDLDTGRVTGLPEKWRQAGNIESHQDEIEAWAAQEGYDLMGTEYVSPDNGRRYYALRPIGLQAWELGEGHWKRKFSDLTFGAIQAKGIPAAGMLLHYDRETQSFAPEKIATFLYRTREGTPGLLYVGVEVRDDSLKPGGLVQGDTELQPIAFSKGRRFGWTPLAESSNEAKP